jgi:hypothetical protein
MWHAADTIAVGSLYAALATAAENPAMTLKDGKLSRAVLQISATAQTI